MTKRLFLIFHGRYPSEKAASLFAGKSAEAFASRGVDVTLIVPKRKNQITDNSFSYYSLKNNFSVAYIPVIDLFESKLPHVIAFWISIISFSFGTLRFLYRRSTKEDVIYSNEIQPLFFTSFIHRNCFYEMHDFPESKLNLFGFFLKRIKWVLVHNQWKLDKLSEIFPGIGIKNNSQKFICEPNAVDILAFDISLSKEEARNKLGLPLDKKIFLYTGHLYGWKGVDVLAEAMNNLSDKYLAIFVGGTEEDIRKFKAKYSADNIKVVGFKKHNEIPLWQKAADILVLPNTATKAISAFYTSPMKLYEYMASRRLIVASDLPSIKEIIDESSAVLVKPDDPVVLAKALSDYSNIETYKYNSYTDKAFARVTEHTWDKRAQRITNFINNHE